MPPFSAIQTSLVVHPVLQTARPCDFTVSICSLLREGSCRQRDGAGSLEQVVRSQPHLPLFPPPLPPAPPPLLHKLLALRNTSDSLERQPHQLLRGLLRPSGAPKLQPPMATNRLLYQIFLRRYVAMASAILAPGWVLRPYAGEWKLPWASLGSFKASTSMYGAILEAMCRRSVRC